MERENALILQLGNEEKIHSLVLIRPAVKIKVDKGKGESFPCLESAFAGDLAFFNDELSGCDAV